MGTSSTTAVSSVAPGTRPRSLLRVVLAVDTVVTGANGLAYVVASGPLGALLGVSPSLLLGAGAFLLLMTAVLGLTATRPVIPRSPVIAIVAVNVVWTLASVAMAAAGWDSPTRVGTTWTVLQAVVVALFAGLQVAGVRRARA